MVPNPESICCSQPPHWQAATGVINPPSGGDAQEHIPTPATDDFGCAHPQYVAQSFSPIALGGDRLALLSAVMDPHAAKPSNVTATATRPTIQLAFMTRLLVLLPLVVARVPGDQHPPAGS